MYLALGQMPKMVFDFGQAAGANPPGSEDPGDATSAIGAATSRDGNSMRIDAVIPVGDLQLLSGLGMGMPYYYFMQPAAGLNTLLGPSGLR